MGSSLLTLTGCHHDNVEAVQLHRFDKLLFDTPSAQLPARLNAAREEYNTELLNFHPEDPQFVEMVQGFVQDPTMREIYRLTDSVFGDMHEEAQQLGEALALARQAIPTLRYDKFYTFISGTFDYGMRIGCNSHELIVSIDQYVLPYTEKYGYFGTPKYLVMQSRRDYLVADCMTAIARQHIVMPEGEMTLLDYTVAEGKAIYFAQQTLPDVSDSILMRYTGPQMKWMKENEENVWHFFMQNKLLYENDYMRFHNFVDDAPQTNAFEGSSPRTTDYIGWHIVSGYVKRTGCTMEQLFAEADSQKILSQSNYRPQ